MKYFRTYHLPYSPGATSDDKIAKSVDSVIGVPIIISEKMDGENNSLTNRGTYARSHADFTISPWSEEVRKIQRSIGNYLHEGLFLFGEGMAGIHSIEYQRLTSYFYLFGVNDNDFWLSWDEVKEYSFLLDIPTVPVLFEGIINNEKELESIVNNLVSKESQLGGLLEGIVIRTQDGFRTEDTDKKILKWVRKDHVTTDTHWNKNWKKAKLIK